MEECIHHMEIEVIVKKIQYQSQNMFKNIKFFYSMCK
jgi:hypothetical protein